MKAVIYARYSSDSATVNFNYRDGAKTVSLKEVESSGLGSSLSLFSA